MSSVFFFCTQDRLLQIMKNKIIWHRPMVLFEVLTKKTTITYKVKKKSRVKKEQCNELFYTKDYAIKPIPNKL